MTATEHMERERKVTTLVRGLEIIIALRGYTGEDMGRVAGYRVAAEIAEETLRRAGVSDDYDPAKDAHDSYYAAIEAKRLRGDASRSK